MSEDGGKGRRESEAIRQHVFRARLAKFLSKPIIAIEDLANDCLSARRVDISLFHRGASRKPSALFDQLPELFEIGRVILLHQTVSIGSAEVEDVVRVFVDELEIVLQGIAQVLVDDLGILPAPFSIQMGITNNE